MPKKIVILEKAVQNAVKAMAQIKGCYLWRNNRGMAKFPSKKGPDTWVAYGVGPNGASDLIGYKPVKITPDMVGQTVAVFMSIETKREDGGVKSQEQIAWVEEVNKNGGIAGFASSVDDFLELLSCNR